MNLNVSHQISICVDYYFLTVILKHIRKILGNAQIKGLNNYLKIWSGNKYKGSFQQNKNRVSNEKGCVRIL